MTQPRCHPTPSFRGPTLTDRLESSPISGLLRMLLLLALAPCLLPSRAHAEAETLEAGDVSLLLFQAVEPFNRYWYHYNGPTDCLDASGKLEPCSRFNLNSYDAIRVPTIAGSPAGIPDSLNASTALGAEVGVLDPLTASGELRLVLMPGSSQSFAIGDSRLGVRYRFSEGPVIVSFAAQLKVPGNYDPKLIAAPGAGQYDLDVKSLLGGLALRRKLFYDLSLGYRMRLGYRNPDYIEVTPLDYSTSNAGVPQAEETVAYAISGPSDEVFADFTLGYYLTRSLFAYTNVSGVNSFKGRNIDDYFITTKQKSDLDEQGRPKYEVKGNPAELLTGLEEDYLRVGVGVLFKPFYSTTLYVNYSYVAFGQNTAAFYVVPNTSIPIGSFSVGLEYTFRAWNRQPDPGSSAASRTLDPRALMSRRLSPGHL